MSERSLWNPTSQYLLCQCSQARSSLCQHGSDVSPRFFVLFLPSGNPSYSPTCFPSPSWICSDREAVVHRQSFYPLQSHTEGWEENLPGPKHSCHQENGHENIGRLLTSCCKCRLPAKPFQGGGAVRNCEALEIWTL